MATQAERLMTATMWDWDAREALGAVVPLRAPEPSRGLARPLVGDVVGGVLTLGTWFGLWAWFLAATW